MSEALEGARSDLSVSGDAMRWSPERVSRPALDLDRPGVAPAVPPELRRWVALAAGPLAWVAADIVDDLRRLARSRRRKPAPRR